MDRGGCIYIMTNIARTVLYIGVTADLQARINEHKSAVNQKSFTAKYKLFYCIYYEMHPSILEAISREKEVKKWSRAKKTALVNTVNLTWKDLSNEINSW
jgi:Predicted endonuclease containing a URI domain